MNMLRGWRSAICTLAVAASSLSCGDEGAVDRRSVILITLDTTRFDALGAFGGQPELTPNLDALARKSVCYDQARTVAPLTLPAHSSMFTGLYPPRHTVRANGPTALPNEATTVAERARAAGFQTAGFVGGLSLDRAYGVAQGFERWTQPEISVARVLGEISDRPASQVVADARAWLKSRDRARPFFLWVHVFDAHAPYVPPAEFLARAHGDPYLGEIASYDAALGELFADFEREHLLERAVLVVCGDHGEARGDHGEDTHGLQCWDATIRVPLFVHHPDGARAGEHSTELASVVDVGPTLLEAMDLGPPADIDGLSLLTHEVPEDRGVYFETLSGWSRFGWSPLAGWCDANGKYVHSSKPQFFDIGIDPGEQHDQIDAVGEDAEHYRERIRAVLSEPALKNGVTASEEVTRATAELGYGGGDHAPQVWPDPLAPCKLPPPYERLDEYREFIAAQSLAQTGRYGEAVAKLEPLCAANPLNVSALDELGGALVEMKEWKRAVEVLERRLKHPPERLGTHKNLVLCYTELGDDAKAREHTLRSLELLIEAHEARGEPELALRYRTLYETEVRANGR